MAAINSPICSSVSGLVLFSAWSNIERGGIGLRGTPVTAERLGSAAHRYRELMAAIRRFEGPRLHELGVNLFPQLGHPVLAERRVDLPQMQVWVVAIPPATELTDLAR